MCSRRKVLLSRESDVLMFFDSEKRSQSFAIWHCVREPKVTRTQVSRGGSLNIQRQSHIGNERISYGFRVANRTIISSLLRSRGETMSLLVVGRSRLSSGANWMVRIKFNFERRHLSLRFVFLLFLHTLSSASLEPGSHDQNENG